jgi:hypothetical protein
LSRVIVALLIAVAFCLGRQAHAQTVPLYAGNVQAPGIVLSPFTFTIPAGHTGTLWVGDAGTSDALRVMVLVYTLDGQFYESFSVSGSQIKNWPGLPAGDYQSIVSFMFSGGGRGSDYFVANLVIN